MSLKYQPKNSDYEHKNTFTVLKITSIAIIILSILTIFLCFKNSPNAQSDQENSKIASAYNKKKNSKKKNIKKNNEKVAIATLKKTKKNSKSKTSKKNSAKKSKKTKTLAQFKTTFPIDKSQANRVFNIKKIVKALNNTVVNPNEEFSFEKIYNLSHKDGKFKITKDSNIKKITYAGGICQVSTTLFQAVKKAKLPVTERHKHSHKVFYTTEGNDAMFSKGMANFKFKNSKKFPIKIKAKIVKNYINIKILKGK